MSLTTASPMIVGPTDGDAVTLQTIGVRFMIPGADSDGRFSLVEHPMPPRGLAAPLHRHNREDEYSFVLEGRVGAHFDGDEVFGHPGDLISSHEGSGTRSGTQVMLQPGSSRSSRLAGSSRLSARCMRWAKPWIRRPWRESQHATASTRTSSEQGRSSSDIGSPSRPN